MGFGSLRSALLQDSLLATKLINILGQSKSQTVIAAWYYPYPFEHGSQAGPRSLWYCNLAGRGDRRHLFYLILKPYIIPKQSLN